VELTNYHKMRTAVQSNASPGSPHDLRNIELRLQQSLMASGMFEDVEVGHTEDVNHLVIAMCKFPSQLTQAQVAARLEQLWEDRLRYGFWEAHAVLVDDDQVEFQGATRNSTAGHYVTLHIVAQKAPIPAQRVGGS
jgi:hypothetical protein